MFRFIISFLFDNQGVVMALPLPFILAGISAAAGAGSAIFGGLKSAKANKKANKAANRESRFNDALFKRDYYSDYTNRKDSQSLLRRLREMLIKNNEQAAATSKIVGGTPEAQLAAKKQAQDTITNTVSNIDAMSSRYKDNVMNRYLNQRNLTYNRNAAINANNAQNANNLMSNGLRTLANSASLFLPSQNKTA